MCNLDRQGPRQKNSLFTEAKDMGKEEEFGIHNEPDDGKN